MTGPQPQSSDTAVRSPTSSSNPHHPVTPHHLPRAKSSPNHPVLRGHTSHVFKECHLGPSFYCTVKGAVPFVPVPTRLSPGEMRQAAILGLDRLSQNRCEWSRGVQILAQAPHPRCPSFGSWATCGYKPRGLSHCRLPALSCREWLPDENLLCVSLTNTPVILQS